MFSNDSLSAFISATAKTHSALTARAYTQDLYAFATWFETQNGYALTPENLTTVDVGQYRDELSKKQKLAAATVNRKIAAIRAYATWLRTTGRLEHNPLNGVKGVKRQPLAPKWLTKLEQAALLRETEKACKVGTPLQQMRGVRDRAIILLLLHAGLRVSELCALELGDIELGARKGAATVRGKGDKERVTPLNAEARKALLAWLELRPVTQSQLIFVGAGLDAQGIKMRAVQKVLDEYGQRARLDDLTPHILRHTCAKNLVDLGVPLDQVAAILGHASLDTTKIYTTPSQNDLLAAVEKLVG